MEKKEVGEKGYNFLIDKNVHNVFMNEDDLGSCLVKALFSKPEEKLSSLRDEF